MKVMAFNARPDERAFFDHFSQSLDMDLTLQKDTLTLDNVALTRGYDGISCTCDLPAPILEKLAENGVRYVALRTIGYDNVDLKAAERLGIRVSHAGYSPYAVSNYTVMLMLMCIRKAGYIMFRSHTADYSLAHPCGPRHGDAEPDRRRHWHRPYRQGRHSQSVRLWLPHYRT